MIIIILRRLHQHHHQLIIIIILQKMPKNKNSSTSSSKFTTISEENILPCLYNTMLPVRPRPDCAPIDAPKSEKWSIPSSTRHRRQTVSDTAKIFTGTATKPEQIQRLKRGTANW